MKRTSMIAGVLLLTAQAVVVSAGEKTQKRGYWWYMDEPHEEAEQTVTEHPERKVLPPPPPRDELMAMHPDELSQLQQDYLEQAVWRPTPEHVRDYYIVQDVIRRKALAYMAVSGLVLLQHPELNVGKASPITNPGQKASTRLRQRLHANALSRYRGQYALVLFSRADCDYCAVQREALARFQERHGWTVKEVDIQRNPRSGERFGVDYTPMTVLIERGSEHWMPVAVGVESVPVIEANSYRGIRLLRGETTPAQFYTLETQQGGVFDPQADGSAP